jgi:hypothetical protein
VHTVFGACALVAATAANPIASQTITYPTKVVVYGPIGACAGGSSSSCPGPLETANRVRIARAVEEACWTATHRIKKLQQLTTGPAGEVALIRPKIDVPIADDAPTDEKLTDYDRLHLITDIQLLDADAEGVPWREASRSLLHIDPDGEP